MTKNKDIREYAKNKGVFLYEVAATDGISEPTITRKLRIELSDKEKADMRRTIDRVADQKAKQAATVVE